MPVAGALPRTRKGPVTLRMPLFRRKREEPIPRLDDHPYIKVTDSPTPNLSTTPFLVQDVQFRTNLGGVGFHWRQGTATLDRTSLTASEPGGGEFVYEWGTLRSVEIGRDVTRNVVTAIMVDGTMIQVAGHGTDVPQMTLATWASLRDSRIEKGGAILEFHPGGYELPALMTFAGQWGGGETQAREAIRQWTRELTQDLTPENINETRNALISEIDNSRRDAWFWDLRAKRIIQRELDLVDAEMRDVTFSSTHARIISPVGRDLAETWIAVTQERDLWVLFFPALDRRLRISDDLLANTNGLPEYEDPVSHHSCDWEPGPYVRFDLERIESLEVLRPQDKPGSFVFINEGSDPAATTRYTNGLLPTPFGLHLFGEAGWEGIQLVLDNYAN